MHGFGDDGSRASLRVSGAVVLMVCVLLGCDAPPDVAASAVDDPAVRRGEFRSVMLLTGELDAITSHPILVPRLPNWRVPIRWLVEDGTRVSRGDRVAELDSSQILADLDNRRIALDGAYNELLGKQAEVAAGVPADVQPLRDWQEKQLALERAENEQAKARADLDAFLAASEADLDVRRIALEGAERDLRVAERALDDMVLRAPRDGIVVIAENRRENRKFQVGDDAWVGLELMSLPELDRMRVRARLFDVDDGRVVPGQRATCTLDTYPDRAFPCAVRSVRPVAKEFAWRSSRRAFDVEVVFEESDPEILRPGMSVRVEVETVALHDVMLVRRKALRFDDDGSARWADRPGGAPVTLGPCSAMDCVVLDGPEPEGAP
jgi:HlyD family secretion protein